MVGGRRHAEGKEAVFMGDVLGNEGKDDDLFGSLKVVGGHQIQMYRDTSDFGSKVAYVDPSIVAGSVGSCHYEMPHVDYFQVWPEREPEANAAGHGGSPVSFGKYRLESSSR